MHGTNRTWTRLAAPLALAAIAAASAPAGSAGTAGAAGATKAALATTAAKDSDRIDRDSLTGRSGKLWMRLVSARRRDGIRVLERLFGDSAARKPGVYVLRDDETDPPFTFVNLVPFSAKQRGKVGTYRLGDWPMERRTARSPGYENPDGFIEVTVENRDLPVSEHFRLRDFLTKDQVSVWPKYLVLQERLLDKLELVIDELQATGIRVAHVSVMSGFRTPQYNQRGVGTGGRAQNSRHQYGDAADVFVDNDRDGQMDDLDGDGRVDTRDARFLAQFVERVETRHPDLVGGVGIYKATSAHGPFVHVDVRGARARW
jgi:hypothetical protein